MYIHPFSPTVHLGHQNFPHANLHTAFYLIISQIRAKDTSIYSRVANSGGNKVHLYTKLSFDEVGNLLKGPLMTILEEEWVSAQLHQDTANFDYSLHLTLTPMPEELP